MEVDSEFGKRVIDQFMEMFIIPEIKMRQKNGLIEKPYPLNAAQILFYPDGKKPDVRLNKEVKALSKVKVNCAVNKGDTVHWDQVDSVEEIILTEEDDPNCGHATLLKINDTWHVAFDFLYNKERSRKHIRAAREFVEGAKLALDKELWSLLIDSLCSASELSSKAYLLSTPDQQILKSKTHGVVRSKINIQRKLGNVEENHIEAFNKLWDRRNYARYLEGEIDISKEEAVEIIKNIEEFIEHVEARCKQKL